MDSNALAANIAKVVALCCILPIALLLAWFSFKIARESRAIEKGWRRVTASVSSAGDEENKVMLEWSWNGDSTRRTLDRTGGFSDVKAGDSLSVWVNPADPSQVRPATFGELWGAVMVTGGFAALLIGASFLIVRFVGGDPMTTPQGFDMERFRVETTLAAAIPHSAHVDDGAPIEMREPNESWKANVFWGLLFGLLLVLPPLFSPNDPNIWKRVGFIAAGVAWMAFMGRTAIQNRGRSVRCDQSEILVSQPFGSRRIALSDIKKVTRRDIREHLRKIEESGTRRERDLDTLSPMVIYILYDAAGKRLLELDKGMQPHRR
jgi:hypothetical protein